MKKLFVILVVLVVAIGISACSYVSDEIMEKMTDGIISQLHDIFGSTTDDVFVESAHEYTDEEIYNAFKEADDFYYCWVYGQLYGDWNTSIIEGSVITMPIVHDEITSPQQLKDKLISYFTPDLAQQYIDRLNPHYRDGKFCVISSGGVGDRMIDYSHHEVEKINDTTYILTLHLKDAVMGRDLISQILCEVNDGRLLFENYEESEYIGTLDYYVYFGDEYINA